eukprot:CAMPEP_0184081916 /NCGR_PEP_ID=MMETSP0974-20121125/2945_1 /TAXON_ID=483370 /ORGANISM="non described non described, Strain CCMP2097" /LENGTH=435 /DNA_ID=CAMNT_0026384591 /DNA_START=68 /DNA_END=1375 /DNA_ORIENTATION=+
MKLVSVACLVSVLVRADDFESEAGDVGGYGGDEENMGYGGGSGYGGMDGGMGGYGGEDDEYGGGEGGKETSPGFEVLDDADAVRKFVAADGLEPAVIGFFDEERDADDISKFEELANSNRYAFRFAYSTEDDVRAAFKFKGGAVLVYPPARFVSDKYDKARHRYPGKTVDVEALKKFAFKKAVPLVGQKTWKSNDRYDKTGVPVVTLFAKVDLEKNAKGFDYFANRLRKVAVDFVGNLSFNIADKEDFSFQLEDYSLVLESKDVGVGAKLGNLYYKMEDKFSVDNLKAFAQALVDGKLTPMIKEEAAPEEPEEPEEDVDDADSAVVALTAANFEETVAGKDAMLEFYAPWCGHCKSLKPVYAKVAAAFVGVDSVVVGAMDATAHDVPSDYDVSGYPTVLFKPANGAAVSYDGDRDVESMVQFIKDNAKTPIADEL